jgi:hypothetical protein
MFPLSHIYIATKVTKKKTPLFVFGSVLPDISWTSESEIGRDQIHNAPQKVYEYIAKNCPDLLDLALGVRLHSNIDKGADYYSDDFETGFAIVEGKKIEKEIAQMVDEEENKLTLVLAHNFIEVATDMNLNQEHPEILALYKESVKNISLERIALCLGEYLNLESKVVLAEINRFLDFMGPKTYFFEKNLFEKLILLIKVRKGKEVNIKIASKILRKAEKIMEDKYLKYLDNTIENMKSDFHDLLENKF